MFSGPLIIIIILSSLGIFIIFLMFAKRQYERSLYKLSDGYQYGNHMPKNLKGQIDRLVQYSANLECEPILCHENITPDDLVYYRFKAIDSLQNIRLESLKYGYQTPLKFGTNLRQNLLTMKSEKFSKIRLNHIHELTTLYTQARYEYKVNSFIYKYIYDLKKDFAEKDYLKFVKITKDICNQ